MLLSDENLCSSGLIGRYLLKNEGEKVQISFNNSFGSLQNEKTICNNMSNEGQDVSYLNMTVVVTSRKSHVVGDGLITQAIAEDVVSLDKCKRVHEVSLGMCLEQGKAQTRDLHERGSS